MPTISRSRKARRGEKFYKTRAVKARKTWKTGQGPSNAGAEATVAAAVPLPKIPRLNRAGTGIRQHKIPRDKIIKAVVEQEVLNPEPTPSPRPGPDAVVAKFGQERREIDADRPDFKTKGRGPLSLEEKIFILEKKYTDLWGDRRIAKFIRRPPKTVTDFVDRYRSTRTLARLKFEAEAENLAKRIIKKADVTQSLEIMDRLDILPKKVRGGENGAPQFNIIVGMPGQKVSSASVPDQKAIEAAFVTKSSTES